MIRSQRFLGDCYLLLGRIYWKLGNTAEANEVINIAEQFYQKNNYELGVGQVESIRSYIYFRTQRYKTARIKSSKSIEIYNKFGQNIALGRAYNMLSCMVRTRTTRMRYDEQGFLDAEELVMKAERLLGGQSKYVESEINLTYGILYFQWSKWLKNHSQDSFERKLVLAIEKLQQSASISEKLDIPILSSVYHGMMGNIKSYQDKPFEAIDHFVQEISLAYETKEKRLLWTLNLFENWLYEHPTELTKEYFEYFVSQWGTERSSEVVEYLSRFVNYMKYISPQELNVENTRLLDN